MKRNYKYKRISFVFSLVLVLSELLCFSIKGRAEELQRIKDNDLYAQAAILMDADSGRVLYEKNSDVKKANASTTKILTCILALEWKEGQLEEWIPVTTYAASQPKVHMGMRTGEEYCLKDLLYAMMLESDNDAAALVGEWIGSETIGVQTAFETHTKEESKRCILAFSDLMNQKVKDIGCEDTCFLTPNGLDSERTITDEKTGRIETRWHGTTAKDLARIMSYCVVRSPQKDLFLEITKMQNYAFADKKEHHQHSVQNHNKMLSIMGEALSGKTGFTNKAGYCYVGAFSSEGRNYVVALLGCGWPNCKNYKWKDTEKLVTYGMEAYKRYDLKSLGVEHYPLNDLKIENGLWNCDNHESYAKLYVDLEGLKNESVLMKKDEKTRMEIQIAKKWNAPILADTQVGKIVVWIDDTKWKEIPIKVKESVNVITYKWCFLYCFTKIYLMGNGMN